MRTASRTAQVISLILGLSVALPACCTQMFYGRSSQEGASSYLELLDPAIPIQTDADGMLPASTCKKVCPRHGKGPSSCSPATLLSERTEERMVTCGGSSGTRRVVRLKSLPPELSGRDPYIGATICGQICGPPPTDAGNPQVCTLLPVEPVAAEGQRFVVCRYYDEGGCAPNVASIGGCARLNM